MAYRPSRRLIFSTLFISALVGGFILLLPEVARRLAINRLQAFVRVPVGIEDVDVNLFTGRAAVHGLVVGHDDPRPILRLPDATLDFSPLRLLTGRIDVERIVSQNPKLVVERLGLDSYNVLRAVRFPQEAEKRDTGGVAFSIERLAIHGGEIIFVDHTRSPAYEVTLSSIDLVAGPISNLPDANARATDFTAGLKIGAGTVKLAGSTNLFSVALRTEIRAEVANLELQAFHTYLPYGERLNLKNTLVDGQGRYLLASRDTKVSEHFLEANLTIGGIGLLAASAAQPIVQIGGLGAQDIRFDFLQNRAQIGALAIDQLYLLLKRDSSGFNLEQLMPGAENATASGNIEKGQRNDMQMPLIIQRAEARGGRIEFVDATVSPAVEGVFHDVTIAAKGVAILPTFAAEHLAAEAQSGKGSIRVTGTVSHEPLQGRFSVTGERLPFQPYRGYLNQFFNSASSSGDYVDGQLKVAFGPVENGEIGTSISGNLEGHNMGLEFPEEETPFLTTARLGVDVRTIRIGREPRVDIDQLEFAGANLRIVRNQEGKLNVARLWAADEQQEPATAAKQEAGTVAIRSTVVKDSAIRILDRSVSPNYQTVITQVRGTLSNLIPTTKRTELTVEGILGESAKLALSGWFTPFTEKPYMELKGTVQSYALPPLNPYATEYVSHRMQRGQITTDVTYRLKGDELHAVAEIVLRDLRLGEKTGDEFTRQVGISLELAIALLQDIQGVIRLQLAMTHDKSVKVDVASLIWRAVRNAIVRSITAPFRLIGKLFTSDDRIEGMRIEPILFEPGTRDIQSQSAKQLAGLSELMKEKPRLELRLNGKTSQDEIIRIKERKFWANIQAAQGKDYEAALVSLYRELGGITRPRLPLDPRTEESLERFVMERIEVTPEDLRELAADRARIVKSELNRRGVNPERLIAGAAEDLVSDTAAAVEVELVS